MDLRQLKILISKKVTRLMWAFHRNKNFTGKKIPILTYHRVLPDFYENETPMYSVLPQQFEQQMKFLAENNFVTLSLNEYDEILKGERDIPERAAVVTFDDGFADIYSVAWPLAKKYGVKINLFVCTGLVAYSALIYPEIPPHACHHCETYPDLWRPLTWQELRQMKQEGVVMGFHGHLHQKMARLNSEQLDRDFEEGLSIFMKNMNSDCSYLAFPHGSVESYNEESVRVAQQYGMQRIFTTQLTRTPVDTNPTLIARIVVHQEDDLATFEHKLFGVYDGIGKIRHYLQQRRAPRQISSPKLESVSRLATERVNGD